MGEVSVDFTGVIAGIIFVTFGSSSIAKIFQFDQFVRSIHRLISRKKFMSQQIAFLVISIEILTSLLVFYSTLASFAVAFVLLAIFQVTLIVAVTIHSDFECSCFGRSERVDLWSFIRNFVLMAFVTAGLTGNSKDLSLDFVSFVIGAVIAVFITNVKTTFSRVFSTKRFV